MSKLILLLTMYIRCLIAQITTEQELMEYCNGVTWTPATKAKWSPGTKTCVQYYDSVETWDDSEAQCQTSKPVGANARLFQAVDDSFLDLAAADIFTEPLKGWVGGKKYSGLHADYTASYQYLGDFRWYEGTQCTSYFNASLISSGGLNNVKSSPSGDCLVFTSRNNAYEAELCTATFPRYCEYYLGAAGNVSCEQTITTENALRDFCVGDEDVKWTSGTCVNFFRGLSGKTWEETYTSVCQLVAPPGAKGRLVHATTPELQAQITAFGAALTGNVGWVGGKRFSVADQSWNPGPGIKDWKWVEGDCETNAFNATEMEPLFNPSTSYDVDFDCLEYWNEKFVSKLCTYTRNRGVCQFYVGDSPSSNGYECGGLSGTAGLKNYCEGDPDNNLWLESTRTCFRRYFDLKNKDDAAQACSQAAPSGTIGRLAIISNLNVALALNSTFSEISRVWLGAVRAIEGGTDITTWIWTDGKTCNKSVDQTLNGISDILQENINNCLTLDIDHGTLNDKLCTEADIGRMCEFYYGEGRFTHGLCKPATEQLTLYQGKQVTLYQKHGECGTAGIFHTEFQVPKPVYCASLCWRMTENCGSFNYDRIGKKCELLSRNYNKAVGNGATASCSLYNALV